MQHLYYREHKDKKWHWHRGCSKFPHKNIKEISHFFNTEGVEFCEECKDIEFKTNKSDEFIRNNAQMMG